MKSYLYVKTTYTTHCVRVYMLRLELET